jgi:hypothetical protein
VNSETQPARTPRKRISWANLSTNLSVIVLVGTELFGAAYGGGWAVANLLGIEDLTSWVIAFFSAGAAVAMAKLWMLCVRAEPVIVDADNPKSATHD